MATSSTETQTGDIDFSQLELQPVMDVTKVQNQPRFKQPITYKGCKLRLSSHPFHTKELKVSTVSSDKSILVPINDWLRKQLDIIEEFVTLNVDLPKPMNDSWKARSEKDTPYKKFYDGSCMYIPASRWCKYYQYSPGSALEYKLIDNAEGEGIYTITFEVPDIYMGAHENNKLISITLRIVEVIFKPDIPNIDKVIEEVLSVKGCEENKDKQPPTKRRRRKKVSEDTANHS